MKRVLAATLSFEPQGHGEARENGVSLEAVFCGKFVIAAEAR